MLLALAAGIVIPGPLHARITKVVVDTGVQLRRQRLSLEERYGTHHGYVAAAKKADDDAACRGYLLAAGPASDGSMPRCATPTPTGFPDDWAVLVNQAIASNVCNQLEDGGKCNPAAP